MGRSPSNRVASLLPLVLVALACRTAEEPIESGLSPAARPEILAVLRDDLTAERSPGDGGGRAWIDAVSPREVVAGQPARWRLWFEAGPLGVETGGRVFLQVPPFWGWSAPQVGLPAAPGYTTWSSSTAATLEAQVIDQQLFSLAVVDGRLAPGDRIEIVYGAGDAGATADRYAESDSAFRFAVDADGDGVRGLLPDALTVDIVAGVARHLVVVVPSMAAVGEEIEVAVAAVDAVGNAGAEMAGSVELSSEGIALPARVELEPGDLGRRTVHGRVTSAGVHRVVARAPRSLIGESNPLVAGRDLTPILWGDLHGHSGLSDGTGTPQEYFRYARDVARLDVVALTDHDHWGLEPLATHPDLWQEIRRQAAAFHQPDRFVTLLGYEWTSWIHGHRHVLYFADDGPLLSSVDPRYESPGQLWEGLRGLPAMTFAHHSAGGPVPTNWRIAPDPELEPVTEIVSVHGSSEAADSPGRIYGAVPGNFVRDVLDIGYRLGFIGSGDSHDGHPGLAGFGSPSSGLAAILASERRREDVRRALAQRRVYATNGPRIVLEVELAGVGMGSVLEPDPAIGGGSDLQLFVAATDEIERIDLVVSGAVVESLTGELGREVERSVPVRRLRAGDYLYVRVVQLDGGAAWSSPIFVD